MNKLSKSTLVLGFISIVIIASVVIALVCVNNQKQHWENKAVEYNLSHWNSLLVVVEQMDKSDYTLETVQQYAPRVNEITKLSFTPDIAGSQNSSPFLGVYYDSFVQMIASEKLSVPQQKEGLALLKTMNKEFVVLMQEILPSNEHEKADFLDAESDCYKNAQQKITAFCDKYTEQLVPFVNG